jgi:hypothetical protein
VCADLVRDALTIPGGRFIYLNTTRGEAERIAWWGNRNDGVASLVQRHGIDAKLNQSKLDAYFPETDAWIYLRGADDEPELRKALGGAYHKVVWDEAQKIPPKLEVSIREVFMPTLLDFGGKFRLTGTPSRQQSGLFYKVTRTDADADGQLKRMPGWEVHYWTILDNVYFGATEADRWTRGVEQLQELYGGKNVAPIESPIMQREGFGRWTLEDSNYVYAVHKVAASSLTYAPHRQRADLFADVPAALEDLPFPWHEGMYAMGVDLGYNDPFAMVLWAWHQHDPNLYEVCAYKRSYLDSDAQNEAIKAIRAHVAVGTVDADAGGIGKQVVKGWSKEWVERYGLPIAEAEKQHKLTAIQTMNNDILRGAVKFREGSPLLDEMRELQWSTLVDGSGRMVEDPTMPNDLCDASLYAHRRSYQFRSRPDERPKTQQERLAREAQEMIDRAEKVQFGGDDEYPSGASSWFRGGPWRA